MPPVHLRPVASRSHARPLRAGLLALALAIPPAAPAPTARSPLRGAATGQPAVPAASLRSGTLAFDAHATTGDFVGTTSRVSGAVRASPDYASMRGWVEAQVSTLQTGNGLRDRDLRKSMEVDRHPTMRYDLSGASVSDAARADSTRLVLHGTLQLHGVSRAVDVPVTIARAGDSARVVGTFPVNVTDYRVGGLRKMMGMLRMDERITVRLDLRFVADR